MRSEWNENLLIAVDTSELYYFLMLIEEEGVEFNAEQLAATSGVVHAARYHRFITKDAVGDDVGEALYKWDKEVESREYTLLPWYHYTIGIQSDVCERVGHVGTSSCGAESGSFGFTCALCNFSINGYM